MSLKLLSDIGDAVIIRHTLFSLPFALLAVLLETGGRPSLPDLALILVAAAAARNAANALNRIIDARIDAQNPRTAGRHLPSGRLSKGTLGAFTALMLAMLVAAAWLLDPLCALLLPLAGLLVFGYSYTKRFTWLCHFWLGITCAAAPMGALIAVSGSIRFRFFVIAGAVASWVAGFDIIYARGDIDFDRREGINSVPARFGLAGSRVFAVACHAVSVAAFAAMGWSWDLGWPWLAAVAACAVLLTAEHAIALGGTERHLRLASYSINELIPVVMLAFSLFDIYLA